MLKVICGLLTGIFFNDHKGFVIENFCWTVKSKILQQVLLLF